MKKVKFQLEVEATYDPECNMGYVYLVPRDEWPSDPEKGGAIPVASGNKTYLVADFRKEQLVGLEFFGWDKFPDAVKKALTED